MSDRRRIWKALAVGSGGLAVVSALIVGPLYNYLGETSREALVVLQRTLPVRQTVLVAAVGLGVVTLVYLRGERESESVTTVADAPPVEAPATQPPVAGREFNRAVDRTAQRKHQPNKPSPPESAQATVPAATLRWTARETLQRVEQLDESTARDRLDAGDWTDDPVAAGFLSEEQPFPLRHRFLRWVRPDQAYRRAVERTGAAIERLATDLPNYRLSSASAAHPSDEEQK